MKFVIKDTVYILHFKHVEPTILEADSKMDIRHDVFTPGKTEVVLFSLDENGEKVELDRSMVVCYIKDTFDKSVGRKNAIDKMFKNRSCDWMSNKEIKKDFWRQYFSCVKGGDKILPRIV